MRAPGAETLRLFLALWPSPAEQQRLAGTVEAAVREGGGRAVPAANLHLTLVFLGSVRSELLASLAALARTQAAAVDAKDPLALRFVVLEPWTRPQVLVALPDSEPQAIGALARALAGATAAAGFTPDLKPFRAHVTVARKVARSAAGAKMSPVTWQCEHVALMRSDPGPGGPLYSVLESFALVKPEKLRE
jgi:2'-5' RNA ligase